jgi:hypothetical protein
VSAHAKHAPKGDGLLPKSLADGWSKIAYGLGAIGVIAFLAGFLAGPADAHGGHGRFGAAYLVGFMFTTTIGIGALFMTVIQHLTKAGWSVAPRRLLEWLAQGLVASVALFIPLFIMSHDVWHHWMDETLVASDKILRGKAAYLNPTFFYIRAIVFLLTWALLAMWFYKQSREQDTSGNRKLSEKMQAAAAPATFALGLTTTFAGFDWVMSLDPHWYSTIYGVYIFAGSILSAMAALSLIVVRLRKEGVGGDLLTVEHQHDIGKFLNGFIVFWAYIGFSQFILIYYAAIPEETTFYKLRWQGGWQPVSLTIFIGGFVIPFLLTLSRTAKRTSPVLAFAAVWVLVMHYIDLYWLVMPYFDKQLSFSWVDIAGLLAPLGITAAWIAKRCFADPAYPLRDPYIPEALKAENL